MLTVEDRAKQSRELQTEMMVALSRMEVQDALGAVCSYLLLASVRHPKLVRTVMNEKVVREGFSGVSLLETIQRACK